MNVKQLKAVLADYPDDMEVILSKDGEGNDYRSLYESSDQQAVLTVDPTYGHIRDIDILSDELCEPGCDGMDHDPEPCDEAPEDAVNVVVLWPTY